MATARWVRGMLICSASVILGVGSMAMGDEQKKDAPADKKPYPLATCVVSGEKLDEMGEPVVFKYEGREVRFCCKDCVKEFKKDPKKYLKKLDDAAKEKEKSEQKK